MEKNVRGSRSMIQEIRCRNVHILEISIQGSEIHTSNFSTTAARVKKKCRMPQWNSNGKIKKPHKWFIKYDIDDAYPRASYLIQPHTQHKCAHKKYMHAHASTHMHTNSQMNAIPCRNITLNLGSLLSCMRHHDQKVRHSCLQLQGLLAWLFLIVRQTFGNNSRRFTTSWQS